MKPSAGCSVITLETIVLRDIEDFGHRFVDYFTDGFSVIG
jgi:hypothetical protein